ncbi:MAG: nuclear transport factor 2 family protein [Deltaproteobacteria bacterium]|nr:nuclear transport factor 2 family protein [Deltaproteobacteria bacterium]
MPNQFKDKTKQEVWQALRDLNDAWTKGNPEQLKECFHKDMVAITATDRERLVGRDACFASWNRFAKTAKIHFWKEIDPQIQIYGNTAVVTYYFDMSFDMGGQTINMGGRDMFVFIKENGKWWAVADQFSPYPL